MAVVISYAGNLEGTLAARGEPVGRYEYETTEAALRSLTSLVLSDELATVEVDDGILVYRSQEDADRDSDGSRNFATIEVQS